MKSQDSYFSVSVLTTRKMYQAKILAIILLAGVSYQAVLKPAFFGDYLDGVSQKCKDEITKANDELVQCSHQYWYGLQQSEGH